MAMIAKRRKRRIQKKKSNIDEDEDDGDVNESFHCYFQREKSVEF